MQEIQSLKNKILMLAIQGKLVPQMETEEPASVLLQKIQQEKEQLIQEKKLKIEKNESIIYKKDNQYFERIGTIEKDITKEIPFDIPQNWQWVRLGHCFSMEAGKFINASKIYKQNMGKFPCYGGNGIRGYVDFYNKEGDFLVIGRQGALCGNVKKVSGKFYATEHAVVVSLLGKFSLLCSFYFLIAMNLNQYATSTAQPGLAVSKILDLFFPLPPLEEQKRITEKVQELFALIDVIEKNKQELEELKASFKNKLLYKAIQGKLGPQMKTDEPVYNLLQKIQKEKEKLIKDKKIKNNKQDSVIYKKDNHYYEKIGDIEKDITKEIPFEIPKTWQWVRLENVCVLFDGIYSENEQLPYLETKYLRGNISAVIKNQGKIVKSGEYVILVDGENSGEVFKVKERGYLGSTFKILNISQSCNKDYLFIFLEYCRKLLKGNKTGSAIPHLDKKIFKNLLFPLPPLEEQHRIAQKIEEIFTLCEKL